MLDVETAAAHDADLARRIQAMQSDYRQLRELQIQLGERFGAANTELESACAEAREQFGTDDHEQLLSIAAERQASNQAAVERYETDITSIKDRLRAAGLASAPAKA
jgi:hypothetical protein